MILPDVNVLIYAHREDSKRHADFRAWLEGVWASPASYAVSDIVLSGCLRVLTHPRVFDPPTPLDVAARFVDQVRSHDNAVVVHPGPRHWPLFQSLCLRSGARGNLVPDAYLAALAIESGSTLVTTDRDFARFEELDWRHPLETA